MKDLYNNIAVTQVTDPATVDATGNSGDIDLQDGNSATLLIAIGEDGGSGLSSSHKLAFKLEHADDDGTGSADSYAACDDDDVLGYTSLTEAGVFFTLDSTDEDDAVYKIGYVGGKRFIKLTWTETGTVSVPMAVLLIQGHLLDSPPIS